LVPCELPTGECQLTIAPPNFIAQRRKEATLKFPHSQLVTANCQLIIAPLNFIAQRRKDATLQFTFPLLLCSFFPSSP